MNLSIDLANRLASLPLDGIVREYPNAPQLWLESPADLRTPKDLHPAFYGCFDWHSAVHGHWSLVRLLKRFKLDQEQLIRQRLADNLTANNILVETEYLAKRPGFERMYGWAWLFRLAQELHGWDDPDGRMWSDALGPLEDLLVDHVAAFLPRLSYPIRVGTHPNTAFALCLIHDYAAARGRDDLGSLIERRAIDYFLGDRDYPASIEPSGADFLSPALIEAALIARILPSSDFMAWFDSFLPGCRSREPQRLFEPALVSDPSDGQISHLIGLNLSRAWCIKRIGLDSSGAAAAHLDAALPLVGTGHYEGDHWLASFALLALE